MPSVTEPMNKAIFADEPTLSEVARYWTSKRRGRLIPDRSAIDPLDLPPRVWPNLLLAEPAAEDGTIRYRLVGSAHVDRYTFDFTGKTTAEIMQGSYRSFMEAMYRAVLRHALPVYSESRFRWDVDAFALGQAFTRRLMLPLSHGVADKAAMVLSVQVWPSEMPVQPRSISDLSGSGGFASGEYRMLDRDSFQPIEN